MLSALSTALSGLRTSGIRLAVTAHNLANQQTDGFKASRAVTAEVRAPGAAVGSGVAVTGFQVDSSPGPVVADAGGGTRELSNTDVAGSLVDLELIALEFRGNLAVISAADEMLDELLNLRK